MWRLLAAVRCGGRSARRARASSARGGRCAAARARLPRRRGRLDVGHAERHLDPGLARVELDRRGRSSSGSGHCSEAHGLVAGGLAVVLPDLVAGELVAPPVETEHRALARELHVQLRLRVGERCCVQRGDVLQLVLRRRDLRQVDRGQRVLDLARAVDVGRAERDDVGGGVAGAHVLVGLVVVVLRHVDVARGRASGLVDFDAVALEPGDLGVHRVDRGPCVRLGLLGVLAGAGDGDAECDGVVLGLGDAGGVDGGERVRCGHGDLLFLSLRKVCNDRLSINAGKT